MEEYTTVLQKVRKRETWCWDNGLIEVGAGYHRTKCIILNKILESGRTRL